jgi:hypothetical protein
VNADAYVPIGDARIYLITTAANSMRSGRLRACWSTRNGICGMAATKKGARSDPVDAGDAPPLA